MNEPIRLNLTEFVTDARDQGRRYTCMAFAMTSAHELSLKVKNSLSEDSLHWSSRKFGASKRGSTVVAASFALKEDGQAWAQDWPYDPLINEDDAIYGPSLDLASTLPWQRANVLDASIAVAEIKNALCSGFGVVVVLRMCQEFWSPVNGKLEIPTSPSWIQENHALSIVGFDDVEQEILLRNSWGTSWGAEGYAAASYSFLLASCVCLAIVIPQ